MTALTVRVEDGSVVASDDEGRTARLDDRLADSLREAWRRVSPPCTVGQVTAAALGAIGEARAIRPRDADEAPAWRTPLDGARVALGPLSHDASRPLAEVLTTRRSERAWSPPALSDVATVLLRGARVAGWAPASDGYVTSHRPTASAGARHPFDLHLLAGDVEGLRSATYVFDPLACELVVANESPAVLLTALGQIVGAASQPPAAVVAVAHTERTLSRYPGGLSLVWRDAGVLLGTLQLCCTDIGLASCLVGSCGVLVDERSPLVIDVGCLLLGARPAGAAR